MNIENRFLKLSPIAEDRAHKGVYKMLVPDEAVFAAFQGARDQVVFTNKRIIAIDVQGMTGKKVDFTCYPYRKIQAYSIETSGVFDRDCELKFWLSAVGNIHFELRGSFDIVAFNGMISHYIL